MSNMLCFPLCNEPVFKNCPYEQSVWAINAQLGSYNCTSPMSFCSLISVHQILLCPPNSLVWTWSRGARQEQKATVLCQTPSSRQPFPGTCWGAVGASLSPPLRTISAVGSTPAFGAAQDTLWGKGPDLDRNSPYLSKKIYHSKHWKSWSLLASSLGV